MTGLFHNGKIFDMLNIHQNSFHPVYLRLANVFTSSSLDIFTLKSFNTFIDKV